MKNKEEYDFRKRHLVFIDIETTGLDRHKHEITEIGCIIVNGESFEIIEEYSAKVKPLHIRTADPRALKISGYLPEKWKDAKRIKEVLQKISEMSEEGMIAGWNIAFDWAFIEENFKKLKIESSFNYHKIDVQAIAYAKLYKNKNIKSLKMRSIAQHFGIGFGEVHSAEEDIKITYEIFKKLMESNV